MGTPLGRYVLLDRIGEGGMAEIFTAVSFGSGGFRRSFVVKRLRPEMATNPVAVAHFIDEANLASTLVHPNIVPVFDFGEVAGSYFLAQEYIVGRDLGRLTRRMVERNIPAISPQAALYIAHEMLRGLHYAHEKRQDDGAVLDLVHRDVTPENAMISERGEVKILDFGIVKAAARVSQTDIGMVKGNVDYMSPEQARGRSVDRRSDVFSTGLVLYFAMARTPLYRGETLFDRLTRAAMGPGEEELGADRRAAQAAAGDPEAGAGHRPGRALPDRGRVRPGGGSVHQRRGRGADRRHQRPVRRRTAAGAGPPGGRLPSGPHPGELAGRRRGVDARPRPRPRQEQLTHCARIPSSAARSASRCYDH